jgi:ferredoxin
MSSQAQRHPQSVPGPFYVTEDCLACQACQELAPNNFRYGEDQQSFVFKQPSSAEETEQCQRAVEYCPMEAVRNDG